VVALLIFESVLVIIALVAARFAPRSRATLDRLGRSPRRATLVVVAAALLAGGLPRLFTGVPRPQLYDEFSYLLAADTFVHGRLTNPTPPLWEHFESFHINVKPSYMSMYPPAQGVALAAGQILGHPWIGVWLSVAAMCGALCWMLQAWLPPGWAFLGGLLAAVRIGMFSYWIESYWGGAVAAFGGALVLGALPRLTRWWRVRDSLLLGCGIAIIANSRPFEGMALALPVAGVLLRALVRQRGSLSVAHAVRALAPLAAVVVLTGAAILYYNLRVTGNPFQMPYAANRAQYAVAGVFMWEQPNAVPIYNHKVMHDFFTGWELRGFQLSIDKGGFESGLYEKIFKVWMFFFGPALTLALVPLFRVFRDRRIRVLLVIGAVSAAILSMSIYFNPHYVAPYTGLFYAVLLQGLRHVRTWGRPRGTGRSLVRATVAICLVMVVARAAAAPLHLSLINGIPTWCSRFVPDYGRETLIANLKQLGGRHLVIVRYAPDHVPHQDWVYNGADLEGAPVVWAREMDPARTARLLQHYAGRRVWLLEPDKDWMKLTPYPQNSAASKVE
jgi:hypothetical protein